MFVPMMTALMMVSQPTETGLKAKSEAIAKQMIRQHKARFGEDGLSLRPSKWNLDLERLRKSPFSFVVIGEKWTGGKENLKYLKDLPEIKGIMFSNPESSDEWCAVLANMPQLEEVYLYGDGITDRGIGGLARLKHLRAVSLLRTNVTDKGLDHVQKMRKLKWLQLFGCARVTNAGLARLKDLTDLEFLNVGYTGTSGEGLVHLQGLTKLRYLAVSPTHPACLNPPTSGLQYLAKMTSME